MLRENRLRNRLDRIEHQLFQANISLLVLIAICLLGFTGILGPALVVLFWVGLVIGFIYLVIAIIGKIMAKKAKERMDKKFQEMIDK
ncbi:MAG: hypothetical protein JW787_18465 [Sedimentisphaerales bacterium]|nr:hypothetical protein [Sedimentisphaerales bacterium]